jgi:hypothetical protein
MRNWGTLNHNSPSTLANVAVVSTQTANDKYISNRSLVLAEVAAGFGGKPVTVILPPKVATAGDTHGTNNLQVVDRLLTVAEATAGLIMGKGVFVEKRGRPMRIADC